jgi:mannose-6-phosphate isomerase-like protein (cupin superfamily)
MKNIQDSARGFSVLENGANVQTAAMVLEPGEASGPYGNEHAESAQVLFLHQGELEAEVDGKEFTMLAGDSVVVAKGVAHRFVNATKQRAVTFNVYSPPAY